MPVHGCRRFDQRMQRQMGSACGAERLARVNDVRHRFHLGIMM